MVLKILVLLVGLVQVPAAAVLSIGTFENAERLFPVYIQPAGWAFSIWGLIYTLSIVYAVYQIIPKYDNQVLAKTRGPALVGFAGSTAWLYFAGMESDWVWLTIPVLFLMAVAFTRVVTTVESGNRWPDILSKRILLPYAAWTGIASWLNVQALLVERGVVAESGINIAINLLLFAGVVVFTSFYFKKSHYSLWYGGVMVWAGVAVVFANLVEYNNWLFAGLAGFFVVGVIVAFIKNQQEQTN